MYVDPLYFGGKMESMAGTRSAVGQHSTTFSSLEKLIQTQFFGSSDIIPANQWTPYNNGEHTEHWDGIKCKKFIFFNVNSFKNI